MNKNTTSLLLELYQKCCAWQSQERVKSIFRKLEKELSQEDFKALKTAHAHYESGEGPDECYQVIKILIAKY